MQNYNNLSPKMTHQNAFALIRRLIHHIYIIWYYYLGTECQHRPELVAFGLSTRKHRTIIEIYNHHRTPCTSYNAYAFYPERTKKTAEALNETAKTDPKTT